jgi:catechol 2,3-dioxygenase-like lactoylglutathione lyase family enzyme
VTEEARLNHLYATVSDLARARAFWTKVVGLEVLLDDDEYLRLGGAGGFTMGMERAEEGDAPELEVVVRVADVDATYERLQAAGVECYGPPEDMPWAARHVWLRDPDGHLISIYSSADTDAK